jgi:hypothetical protein
MAYLNASYKPAPSVNMSHNLKIVYITDFAPNTPPALNIFMAYQMAQGSQPGSAILINTPYYVAPNTPAAAALPTFESVLKPPVQPVYDANYAALVGITAPNGLITYPIQLFAG